MLNWSLLVVVPPLGLLSDRWVIEFVVNSVTSATRSFITDSSDTFTTAEFVAPCNSPAALLVIRQAGDSRIGRICDYLRQFLHVVSDETGV